MKVAIAVWNGRISPVFDVSRHVLLLEVEKGAVIGTTEESFDDDNPVRKASKLAKLGAKTLLCGAISRSLAAMLAAYGIRTIPFIAGKVEEVIEASLAGALPNSALSMPGCCGRRTQFRGGWHRKNNKHSRHSTQIMPRADGPGPRGNGPRAGWDRGQDRGSGLGKGRRLNWRQRQGRKRGGSKSRNRSDG